MHAFKRYGNVFPWVVAVAAVVVWGWTPVWADDEPAQIERLEDVVVHEKGGAPGQTISPSETVIDVDTFTTIGVPDSVLDVLRTQASIDFRGETNLDPGVDSIHLRGFDSQRFVTALDSLTTQKTGGRKSSNIVDYALLPAFLIDRIEILPGPHSALYDSKSIGGVLNLVSQSPRRRERLKPEMQLTTSYGTYETQTHQMTLRGAVNAVTYDLAYQKYATDGYLRNNAIDIDNVYGRIGYVLPLDGFIALSAVYSDVDRQAAVNNPGQTDGDYDDDYPRTEGGPFDPFAAPTWDGIASAYRLNYEQTLPIGRLHIGAYYGEESRDRAYYVNPGDMVKSHSDTEWWQQGGKIQDAIRWSVNHLTTVGFDIAQLYDDGIDDAKTKRVDKQGTYLQHQWTIVPALDLKVGLRHEDVEIRVSNSGANSIPGRGQWIDRHWDELIPKSFATYKMDGLAPWLRDTSLSAGISKIWRAPDAHGDYNPQGRPAGAWLAPENGIGYDLVFNRRLWGDIAFKANYAFYRIKDYIASNSSYANYSGAGAGSLRFSDYKINLEEVYRHGVDVALGGHLADALSFYLTYAWQTFENQGEEPAGETELDQRAEHRVGAGLRYAVFDRTTLLLDYAYQSQETTEISEEVAPDVWDFRKIHNDAYHLFSLGVQQTLFKQIGWFDEGVLSVYVKNLLDEEYYDTSGFPATDRTFGASFSVKM
ncbi:MAG: outer membrane receptor protein [Desulfatitalea sp. BRH_c12]|nr:MAG: outer membrane receptor protein [Desulfatitalea sp. BRH_c12]